MAHKKSWWTAQNVHDSPGQRLWIKKFAGQAVIAWNILARQRGNKYYPWAWVWMWKDHTLYALVPWVVYFTEKRQLKFNWRVYRNVFLHLKSEPGEVQVKKAVKKVVNKIKKEVPVKSEERVDKVEKVVKIAPEKIAVKKPAKKPTVKAEKKVAIKKEPKKKV